MRTYQHDTRWSTDGGDVTHTEPTNNIQGNIFEWFSIEHSLVKRDMFFYMKRYFSKNVYLPFKLKLLN